MLGVNQNSIVIISNQRVRVNPKCIMPAVRFTDDLIGEWGIFLHYHIATDGPMVFVVTGIKEG